LTAFVVYVLSASATEDNLGSAFVQIAATARLRRLSELSNSGAPFWQERFSSVAIASRHQSLRGWRWRCGLRRRDDSSPALATIAATGGMAIAITDMAIAAAIE
jgi:hypothetical protein